MCGIVGIISLEQNISNHDISASKNMLKAIQHRGPDNTGTFQDKNCCLSNARLKILDLSNNANLPFINQSKTVVLAYNGEVTNFRELITEHNLREKYKFTTSSDTEVVLHLYEEYGIEFLKYLSGMFAFCIYDIPRKKLYIVRDFFGTRPLFYMQNKSKLFFSSEIKSFFELKEFNKELDKQALFDFFTSGYIPGENTQFSQIKELAGGNFIEIDLQTINIKQYEYYRLNFVPKKDMSLSEAVQGFQEVMSDSVSRNLISDVPIGITLSGGIDSSTLLAFAKNLHPQQEIHTFSLKIRHSGFDESPFQRAMAKHYKSIHHEIPITPKEIIDYFERTIACLDEPLTDGSSIPHYILAERAKAHVRVLLSGEGGDEIGNAYETHGAYALRKVYRSITPKPIRTALRLGVRRLPVSFNKLSTEFLLKRFTVGSELDTPSAHIYWRHVFTDKEKRELMIYPRATETESLYRDVFDTLPFSNDLEKLTYLDLYYFFIGDLMIKNDRPFMAHSIEGRFPFMDRKVVEFTATIPIRHKIKCFGLNRRYFHKQAVKNLLPPIVRKRSGFGIELPHSFWFHETLEPLAKTYLAPELIESTGFLNYDFINNLFKQHKAKKADHGRALWTLISFMAWYYLFIATNEYKQYFAH